MPNNWFLINRNQLLSPGNPVLSNPKKRPASRLIRPSVRPDASGPGFATGWRGFWENPDRQCLVIQNNAAGKNHCKKHFRSEYNGSTPKKALGGRERISVSRISEQRLCGDRHVIARDTDR
jgi:hypothetical protein